MDPSGKAANAEFSLNIKAKKFILLAGDKMMISNKNMEYKIEIPEISYSIYKVVL